MDDFLRVLIVAIKTIDGTKGSFENAYREVFNRKAEKIKQNLIEIDNRKILRKAELTEYEEYCINKTTLFQYKLLRIRAKISFSAFIKNYTIRELIMRQINNLFQMLVKVGEIQLTKMEVIMNSHETISRITTDRLG
jgi:hypothetical protein